MRHSADLVVVGAGPAGLSAAINGASEGFKTVVLERSGKCGGQFETTSRIENYLGFPTGLTGAQLAARSAKQARRLGAEIHTHSQVVDLRSKDGRVTVSTSRGLTFDARAVVLTVGVTYRQLRVPGVDSLVGRGIHYGVAPKEAREFRGQQVVVVGGGNSAGQAALFLTRAGAQVLIVARRPLEETMSDYLLRRCVTHRRIDIRVGTQVVGVGSHEHRLAQVTIADGRNVSVEEAQAMIVFIGAEPRVEWIDGLERDGHGFIVTDGSFLTSLPGVFAAGDVRAGSIKRIAAAVGEGSEAIGNIHDYLS